MLIFASSWVSVCVEVCEEDIALRRETEEIQLAPPDKISLAIKNLHSALPSRAPRSLVADQLSLIGIHVYEHGLSPQDLLLAAEVLTSPAVLTTSDALQLVKLLIPKESVGDEVVLRIVGCLGVGQGKAEPAVQVSSHILFYPLYYSAANYLKSALLRWLVIIQPFLKSPKILSSLYNLLFLLLSYESIRPWLCHILFLITTRRDIKPWRIQYLLELQNKYRDSQHLTGLLVLYKEYYPEIIIDRFFRLRSTLFRYPDPALMTIILDLHRSSSSSSSSSSSAPHISRDPLSRSAPKRRKLALPDRATLDQSRASVTVEDISSLTSFVHSIDRIALPAQVGSVLRDDGMVRLVLVNRPGKLAWARLNTWIASTLSDELSSDSDSEEILGEMLARVSELCDYTTDLLVSVEDFLLSRYLKTWAGRSNRQVIFNLLLLLKIRPWPDLHDDLLSPLSSLYHSPTTDPAFKKDYVLFLTELYASYARQFGPASAIRSAESLLSRAQIAQVMEGLWREIMELVAYDDGVTTRQVVWYINEVSTLWVR
ncbi:Mis6-domain-containing protein [Myxozyma melibiosi]|uniref:Mis6-domain-containing protein n=1 Tax=Myxozyma melibiosi TaxID=54550 RepID=A0ABR1EY68_9ASCO